MAVVLLGRNAGGRRPSPPPLTAAVAAVSVVLALRIGGPDTGWWQREWLMVDTGWLVMLVRWAYR